MPGNFSKEINRNDIITFCPEEKFFELFSYRGYISKNITGKCYNKYPPFIKRVVAITGDKIEIKNDDVYLNENLVKNSNIYNVDKNGYKLPRLNNGFKKILEINELFVYADGVNRSLDSRYIGIINKNNIISKAYLILEVK